MVALGATNNIHNINWTFWGKITWKNDFEHLLAILRTKYKVKKNWGFIFYVVITLKWYYLNLTVDLTILVYVEAILKISSILIKQNCRIQRTRGLIRNMEPPIN